MTGKVKAILIAEKKGEDMRQVPWVLAIAGQGLKGDRYATGEGSWSKSREGVVRHASLIELEAIQAANKELGENSYTPAQTRRNIITKGVDLNSLVGREFFIGSAHVLGVELCDPCDRPDKLSGNTGFKSAFDNRGGLRVEILATGLVAFDGKITI